MKVSAFVPLFKETFKEWGEDKVSRLAAALAYFTVFSIAPLLIIAISVAAIFFGEEAARGQIVDQIQGLMGPEGAAAVESMIANANQAQGGLVATIIGVVTLLFGASGVFAQLQDALNTIWEVAPKPGQGIANFVRSRFLSFGMVLIIAFLLLVSLVISAAVAGAGTYVSGIAPGMAALWEFINFLISFGVITLLFAAIYKVLPDVKIVWSDVWIGAAVTALLFTIGRTLIGLYLGNAAVGSAYGAAGSLVVLLVWVFYSAQILLFGAEFTQVYTRRHGSHIRPAEHAVSLTDDGRVQQGIPRNQQVEAIARHQSEATADPASVPQPHRRHSSLRKGQGSTSSPHPVAVILGSVVAIVGTMRRGNRRGTGGRRR
ncbi:MAG: YihY/virulence factor BrkB family protein [Leptolyngbya sp. DLM2.Bin27]|nr:MAG: YihY/virulence factor BrkB family protein [Leptolyngbya sp. DLM2.Bin27]